MKMLITGKGSYIGHKVKTHLEQFGHQVDEVDTVGDEWKAVEYSSYDSVIHVAAIVHDDAKSASEDLFYTVNTKLPNEIALLAKQSGVRQFIFISTMAVFGADKTLSKTASVITDATPTTPTGMYGKSKLAAEEHLKTLETDTFKIAVVRPPNVYGPGCRGNYIYLFNTLSKLMRICPEAFTEIRQSMLYIDNLSELIRLIAEKQSSGLFMPQDDYIPSTVDLIVAIRNVHKQKTHLSKVLGKMIRAIRKINIVNKIYGGVYYDETLSELPDFHYRLVSFHDGIQHTYNNL